MTLLALRAAHLGYASQEVLHDVHLAFETGEFVSVVGGNGSGKTTLIRSLLGVLPLRAGHLDRSPDARLGYCPQQLALDPLFPLCALEVVEMGLWRSPRLLGRISREDRAFAADCLVRVGMAAEAGRLFRELSGGQKQRVLVARALASRPNLLLLDEPTAGVDRRARAAIRDMLGELWRDGVTVVVVTHDSEGVGAAASRVLEVGGGRVRPAAGPDDASRGSSG